jgi:5-methylcytosine-specific restriction endonuclease McrA
VRDPSLLDQIREDQRSGRCAFCEKPLRGKQRVWCGDVCRGEAYDSSVIHDWSQTRDTVFERDGMACAMCGRSHLSRYREGPMDLWAEVDHVLAVSEAPERQYDLENLRTVCHRCHAEKTAQERLAAAAGLEAAEKTAQALIGSMAPRAGEWSETGSIPRKIKEQMRLDLLNNMPIEDASRKYNQPLNSVKGVWSALKSEGRIPKDAKAGEMVFSTAAAPGLSPPPTSPADFQPSQLQAAGGPQTVQVPVSVPPTPPPIFQGAVGAGGGRPPGFQQAPTYPVTAPQPMIQQPAPYAAPAPPTAQGAWQPPQFQTPPYSVVQSPVPHDGIPNGGPSPQGLPLTVQASGFVTKVFQNAKVLIWWDYFRQKNPKFDGDFADFVGDCVEYFFKSQGLSVVIKREERVA